MEIQNGRLAITLDERTGEPVHIVDRATGLVHLDARAGGREDGRLFRLIVPSRAWGSRYVDSHESPPPEIEHEGSRVRLRYADLKARGVPTGVSVDVFIETPAGSDEIRFSLEVHNGGTGDVLDILFPWIGGWTGLGGRGKDLMVLGAYTDFDPWSFPLNLGGTWARAPQRVQLSYPFDLYAPWIDLSGPGGGISYINYMSEPKNGYVSIENLAGHGPGMRLAFGWVCPTVVRPGESWRTDAIGIAVHGGDWHETADRYQAWMRSWFTPPPGKPALRESIGFQNVMLRGFDGTPFHGLDQLPAIAAAGRRAGVDQLCIWDFVTLGEYAKHSDVDFLEYAPEEWETLARGLKQARAEGTNVSALVNFRLCSPQTRRFREGEMGELFRTYYGSPHMEHFPATHCGPQLWAYHLGPHSYILSPFSAVYRERVLRQMRRYLELGYTSMFFDQPFAIHPDYGALAAGARPEQTYGAVQSLLGEIRELLHRNDPDAFMIGEFCDVFAARRIDLWMCWYKKLISAARAAYSIPQTINSWVVDADIGQACHAFALGLHLCLMTHGAESSLEAEPEFAAYVGALARLRRRCAARTVHARFRHDRGLRVEGDGALAAYAFDGPAGPAVIVAAPGAGGRAVIEIDRAAFTNPGRAGMGCLQRLDGSTEPRAGDRQAFELKANDVAVWEL